MLNKNIKSSKEVIYIDVDLVDLEVLEYAVQQIQEYIEQVKEEQYLRRLIHFCNTGKHR